MKNLTIRLFAAAIGLGGTIGFFGYGIGGAIAGVILGAIIIMPIWLVVAVGYWLNSKLKQSNSDHQAPDAQEERQGTGSRTKARSFADSEDAVESTTVGSPTPLAALASAPANRGGTVNDAKPAQKRESTRALGSRWIPPGEPVQVGPYRIEHGMIYVSDGNSTIEEASLINLQLPVGRPARGEEAALGYWTDYARITPNQRASYLEWLASGRRDADASSRDFGYLFLFFYGIERQLLVDRGRDEQPSRAVSDVMNLYAPLGRSTSLSAYTCQLLHFWGYCQGMEYYAKFWPWVLQQPSCHVADDDLSLVLANLVEMNRNLPFEVAYEVASRHEMAKRSTVLKRVPEEFRQLLQSRFRETYPDGFVLRAAKRARRVEYRPASPSLLQLNVGRTRDTLFTRLVTNVTGVPSQFGKLIELWNRSLEDLAAYSRAKGKEDGTFSVKAHSSLPQELRGIIAHPLGERWLNLLSQRNYGTSGYALLLVSDLAVLFGQEPRAKLTPAQAREIGLGTQTLGFSVEPDLTAKGVQAKWEDEVGVFPNDSEAPVPAASRAFLAAKALLTLCYSIAAADGEVSENELGPIRGIIEKAAGLHESEHKRLIITEQLLSRDPTRAAVAVSKIANLIPEESRDAVADLLVQMGCADGIVTKDERRALLKVFRELKLSAERLDGLIRKSLRGFEDTEVIAAGPQVRGEAIPQPGECENRRVRLDFARIASITRETQEVIAVLSAVMIDEEPEALLEPLKDAMLETSIPTWLQSAPTRYHAVILDIALRASVPRVEFDDLCARHHVMPAGAIDAINEWAEESLGDFLMTDDDPMVIASDLISREK